MKNFGIYPKLTKKYILDRITQEQIMGKFLNISVTNETLASNSINSPYRSDTNPSCNYYYNERGKLRFKDNTTGLNYDMFDVVAKTINVSSNSKQGFIFCLHEIARAFRIHKYTSLEEVKNYDIIKQAHKKKQQKNKTLVQYFPKLRKFNYHDKNYFIKGGLEEKDLYGVYLIQHIYVRYNNNPPKLIYSYTPKDPCYGYYGQKDEVKKIDLWKFYFPLRIKGDERGTRFISNGSFLQGYQYLIPDRICVITKSFKDVKVFNKIGLQSFALNAESTLPSKLEMFFVSKLFDFLITCFDYDRTGKIMAKKMRDIYRVTPIMFTNDFKGKDAFEFVENNSLEELKEIINRIFLSYKPEIDKLIKEINSKLKQIL